MKLFSHLCILVLTVMIFGSCSAKESKSSAHSGKKMNNITSEQAAKLDTAYFAEGCFWCTEEVFQRVKGVKDAVSGFSGGTKPNPTYAQVGRGGTDYAESVEVFYDPEVVSYNELLRVFFNSQDPTQANGQGPDIGESYRSIIFYQNEHQKKLAEQMKQQLNDSGQYDKPIAVEITSFDKFYAASEHHQEYFTKHPNAPYIVHESKPRVARFMKRVPDLLKEEYK